MRNWYKKIVEKWFKHEYGISYAADIPNVMNNRTIYLIGVNEYYWLIAFNCPCGCKKPIQLNLLKDAYPCWTYSFNKKGKINIFPSILRTNGCNCHFIVHKSKIVWAFSQKMNTIS